MPSKRHQNGALLKIFHRRPQIMKFCACKRKLLAFRRLSRFSAICAISKRRKAAFFARNVMICSAVRVLLHRNGAAVIMQRRPYRNATGAPLQPREGLTAEPRHLRHAPGAFPPLRNGNFICHRFLRSNVYNDVFLQPLPTMALQLPPQHEGTVETSHRGVSAATMLTGKMYQNMM